MDKKLDKYAELLVKIGVNLTEGEMLTISADIKSAELVRAVTECAYKAGAKKVLVFYNDDKISRLNYTYQSEDVLGDVPEWFVKSRDYMIDNKSAYLVIISDDPDIMKDVPPSKIKTATQAANIALKRFRESTNKNETRWCIGAYPNKEWGSKMFPDLSPEAAEEKLWTYIHKTMFLDCDDPLAAWTEHCETLEKRCNILNSAKIDKLHYKNSIGTDFEIGLPDGYIFIAAREKGADGKDFIANMPTQEVFTSPDYRTANGRLYSSLPLVRRGVVIKDFWFEFKDGKIVDFAAKEGYETLKGILDTDEGMLSLGEVALVAYESPIQQLKTLFYETLFDENASCHFAVGGSFPSCVADGVSKTKDQLKEIGLNDSIDHVDFMIGTSDLDITATLKDGSTMQIFKNGNWSF